MLIKVCSKCRLEKSVAEFYKSSDGKHGVRADCKDCNKKRVMSWRNSNPTYTVDYCRRHRDRINANSKRRRIEKPDYHARWRKRNSDKVRAVQKRANDKFRASPQRRLESAIAANVRNGLVRDSKLGRSTFQLLGYSSDQLRTHLEARFQPGMSWDNYGIGGWHVDHIIPLAAFNYTTPNDIDFRRAWALSNLQPLWAGDNIRKNARLDKPFQPSLSFG